MVKKTEYGRVAMDVEVAEFFVDLYARNTRASYIRHVLEREIKRWKRIEEHNAGSRPDDAEFADDHLMHRCVACDGLGFATADQEERDTLNARTEGGSDRE